MNQEMTTKEKILQAAIQLFADKGYDGVSVRDIANAVSIKASSLYKHYQNKEDILESIFEHFKKKMGQTVIPEAYIRSMIKDISPLQYLDDSFMLFKQIMWAPDILKIAKIITKEQQRNRAIRLFFTSEMVEKPTQNLKTVFDCMIQNGTLDATETALLAEEYTAYVVYLYFEQNFLKDEPNLEEIEHKMKRHNAYFAKYMLSPKEG